MATFDVRVHAMIDGENWTDISDDVQYEDRVRIRAGAGNQGARVDPTSCEFRLRNDSGQWTPSNPQSPNYPDWGRGTRIRASVYTGEIGLVVDGSNASMRARTPDDASLDITGDIDARVECALWNLTISDAAFGIQTTMLMGKHGFAPNRSWMFGVKDGRLYVEWSTDGSNLLTATATIPLRVPGSNPKMALRFTLDVNNGAGGHTVRFFRADTIDGDWQEVGDPVVGVGVTSLFSSTQPLDVGHVSNFDLRPFPNGTFYRAELRNGIDGTVVANPDFTAQAEGTTSFADGAGRTWSTGSGAEITARKTRFTGEVASLAPGRTRKDFKFVDVQAAGIMRRLGANDERLKSAVFRDLTKPTRTDITGYWPMEDGEDADVIATPIEGATPAEISDAGVNLAAYTEWGASSAIPTFDNGYVIASMPMYTVTSELSTRFFMQLPSTGVALTRTLLTLYTTGTGYVWIIDVNNAGNLQLRVQDQTFTDVYSSGFAGFNINGLQKIITLEMEQVGADVNWSIRAQAVTPDLTSGASSGTVPSRTFGRVNKVRLNDGGDFGGGALGQLAIATELTAFLGGGEATANWQTEPTWERVSRLTTEEGIELQATGFSDAPNGGQGESDLLTLLRDSAAVEQGLLGEGRTALALLYRTPDSLSSQQPVFTVGYGDGSIVDPFEPVYDDNDLVNDFTASRNDGGFTRYQETEGRLSVNDVPAGVGPYEGAESFNTAYDTQTGDLAAWLVHLGTFEGARFSRLRVLLHKLPALVDDFCRAYIGDVGVVTGVPLDLAGTDDVRLRVEGYSEAIDQYEWEINYVMSPGEPWQTGFAGYDDTAFQEEEFAWADTSGSELAEDLTDTETAVDVLTTDGPVWTSDPFDSPYRLKVAGEHMVVQAPGSVMSANPFFTTDTTSWSGSSATIARSTTVVNPHPEAVASLAVTPDGVGASASARTDLSAVGTVTPGQRYVVSCWVRLTSTSSGIRPEVQWYDAAGVLLSSSGSALSANAREWTFLQQTVTAPASASRYRIAVRLDGTPPSSDVFYAWAPRLNLVSASLVYDEFGRTATDSWGAADSGQTWTNTGGVAADFDVLSGYGRHIQTATGIALASSITAYPDFDIYCDMTVAATSTGASQFAYVMGRRTDSSNLYQARLDFTTTGSVNLTLRKRLAAVETQLASATAVTTYVAGTFVRCRFQGFGSALKAKVWALTEEEPHAWDVEATDTDLPTGSIVGVRSVRNIGNTNASADIRFDNFDMINAQTFTVERSANSVVKTQTAGEDVRLAFPAVPGI